MLGHEGLDGYRKLIQISVMVVYFFRGGVKKEAAQPKAARLQ
jgi:hypothetical protein